MSHGNHTAYSRFYTSYVFIVKALEVTVYKIHLDEYDHTFSETVWDTKTKNDASAFLASITNFEFIVAFL